MMKKTLTVLTAVAATGAIDSANYNAWIGGDFSCKWSDTEGRLAVGGNANIEGYAVNTGTYANYLPNADSHPATPFGAIPCSSIANDDPAILVGGSLTAKNGQCYSGSIVYGTQFSSSSYNWDTTCQGSPQQNSNAATIVGNGMTAFSQKSTAWATYATTGSTNVVVGGDGKVSITLSSVERQAIFNLNGSDLSNCNSLTLDVPSNAKLVLINVNGAAITISGFQMFNFGGFRSKTIFNLYEATSVSIVSVRVGGALIAPGADILSASGAIDGQVVGKSYAARFSYEVCAQINLYPFDGEFPAPPPSPPSSTCGDGIVETGEDCDGGACCSNTCTFLGTSVTCRPSAGECDIPETCSGLAAACPADTFKDQTVACGSNFGVCDVRMQEHCPGNAATCRTAPRSPATSDWEAYNVISFGDFNCFGGDVEGRLAVRNNLNVSGFTVGLMTLPTDAFSWFDLVVGGDATYTDGSVNSGQGNNNGDILVNGIFNAPQYLRDIESNTSVVPLSHFDDTQAYFVSVSNKIASLGTNAKYSVTGSGNDGLVLTCDDATSAMYIVQVPTTVFNNINWYVTENCKLTAAWLVTLTGTSDVSIQGAPFPGIVERVVYNIPGSRTVRANNGVAANIIAPQAAYLQTTGVTYGKVVVGTVLEARQNNKPNCLNFQAITITQQNLVPVNAGDNFIYVYDLTAYIPGDLICQGGSCQKIVSGTIDDQGKRLNVDQPLPEFLPAFTQFSTLVSNPTDESRSATLPIENNTSGASALVASMAIAFVALFF
eukprot:TRINITY_DN267_c0_g2_i1.p1 TRINITY_DN267_c0_g2~~TRINITY_DN267_c0_g2_i1.p1  ORF type:complete len:774 (-),score=232.84 TRINITY_DN267_c0_g2_i1:55-2376(-)